MQSVTIKLKSFGNAPGLLSNGYALVANAGLSSVLGLVFWLLATRLFPQDQVGLGAAMISSMMSVSYLSQMNLSSLLVRFLPMAGRQAKRLILYAYACAAVVSALVAFAFASGVGLFAEPLEVLKEDPKTTALFVGAVTIWSLFALQDAAFSGMRRSVVVPVKNAAYAASRIAALAGLALVVVLPANGIFLASVLPLIPILLATSVLLSREVADASRAGSDSTKLDLRSLGRFLGWDSVGTVALAAAFGLAPIMVAASSGVESNATYHIAWTLSYSIYLIGRSMCTSLVAEGAANPARLRALVSDTLVHSLGLITGAVLVMVAAAPMIMAIFGSGYVAEGSGLLRLLALSCVPWSITTVYISLARARGQTRTVASVQICTLLVFGGASYLLLDSFGAFGVAAAWLIANSAVCVALLLNSLRTGREPVTDWSLAMIGSVARLAASLRAYFTGLTPAPRAATGAALESYLPDQKDDVDPRVVRNTQSDVTSIILEPKDHRDGRGAVLRRSVMKIAGSERGQQALSRNARRLEELAGDGRVAPYKSILPELLRFESDDETSWTIETAVSGYPLDGVQDDNALARAAAVAAVATMHDLHQATAVRKRIDEPWTASWIDAPLAVASSTRGVLMSGAARDRAFASLRSALREILLGRQLSLGLGHGDLWAGNLFYEAGGTAPRDVRISGLIDWDTARKDAPEGWDAGHMAITLRMSKNTEELGPAISALLREGAWSDEEYRQFAEAGLGEPLCRGGDPELQWALVILIWLHHVSAGVAKSDSRARNRLWCTANVDRVLLAACNTPPWSRHVEG